MASFLFRTACFSICIIVTSSSCCFAQETAEKPEVVIWVLTNDGNEYIGIVEIRNSREISLKTKELGLITIPIEQVRKIREVDPAYFNSRFPHLFSVYRSKYYTTQSAETLSKGQGYYQNGLILYNQAAYGITNNVTVGLTTFLPVGVWANVKAGLPLGQSVYLAGNVSLGTRLENGPDAIGQFMSMITFSGDRASFTFGAGLVLEDGIIRNEASVQVSAAFRTGPRGSVIVEFNALNAEDIFDRSLIVGGRTRFRKVSLDYGLGIFNDGSDIYFLPLPWVGVVVPF